MVNEFGYNPAGVIGNRLPCEMVSVWSMVSDLSMPGFQSPVVPFPFVLFVTVPNS
jgi:hypothetical protein